MKALYIGIILVAGVYGCKSPSSTTTSPQIEQSDLSNPEMKNYKFLEWMYKDDYFPKVLVDKCKNILVNLCHQIEIQKPGNSEELCVLTHKATEELNQLQNEFHANNSEIETAAAEFLVLDIQFIAEAYGFKVSIDELTSNRDW
jgi:hypothetical protein